jgi:hypothetical protein
MQNSRCVGRPLRGSRNRLSESPFSDCGRSVAMFAMPVILPDRGIPLRGGGLSMAERFTDKQGQYLAFIHNYTVMFGRPPAEADLQRLFPDSTTHNPPDASNPGGQGSHQPVARSGTLDRGPRRSGRDPQTRPSKRNVIAELICQDAAGSASRNARLGADHARPHGRKRDRILVLNQETNPPTVGNTLK